MAVTKSQKVLEIKKDSNVKSCAGVPKKDGVGAMLMLRGAILKLRRMMLTGVLMCMRILMLRWRR